MSRDNWIQINDEHDLRQLERFVFTRPVNAYKKKPDSTGAILIRIGYDTQGRARGYRGETLFYVRCMSDELVAPAEKIVQRKLGLTPRAPGA